MISLGIGVERIVERLNEPDTCEECGGYVIDLRGTWLHKPSCSRRTGPQREPDGTWSPTTRPRRTNAP